jgi:arylsulfatase A-like enzyme
MRHRSSIVRPERATRRALLAALLVVGLALAGCSREPRQPNVLLLTIDTLRADHLGCYGGTRVATPNIDRLAREGALFENAACPMPMTRPSLTTIHTSLHPREHGVVNNAVPLAPDSVTLATTLATAGYATAAFTPVRLLDASSGLAQGFASYIAPDAHHLPADCVAPGALDWLAQRDPAKPFFVWLHLFDPHLPYAPPPQYAPGDGPDEISWKSLLATANAHDGDVPKATLARALELYAGEVAYVDHWVGEIRARLESLGVLDDTIVVFTADHGECFDHGIYFEHADCLYEGAVHVPLVIRFPRGVTAGKRVQAQVEHMDLAPTILSLAGIARPPAFRGRTLLPSPPAATQDLRADAFALIEHPLYPDRSAEERSRKQERIRSVAGVPTREILTDRQSNALRGTTWKLITDGASSELYDLPADRGEQHDLATRKPELVADLRRLLDEKLAQYPLRLRESGDVNPKLRETLKALGYVQ